MHAPTDSPWPSGTTVYEIDQPDVVDFKTETLTQLGARPAALSAGALPVDLRHDWPAALKEAGFDPNAAHRLERRGAASLPAQRCPGSTARQHHRAQPERQLADLREHARSGRRAAKRFKNGLNGAVENWRKHGFDVEMTDLCSSSTIAMHVAGSASQQPALDRRRNHHG